MRIPILLKAFDNRKNTKGPRSSVASLGFLSVGTNIANSSAHRRPLVDLQDHRPLGWLCWCFLGPWALKPFDHDHDDQNKSHHRNLSWKRFWFEWKIRILLQGAPAATMESLVKAFWISRSHSEAVKKWCTRKISGEVLPQKVGKSVKSSEKNHMLLLLLLLLLLLWLWSRENMLLKSDGTIKLPVLSSKVNIQYNFIPLKNWYLKNNPFLLRPLTLLGFLGPFSHFSHFKLPQLPDPHKALPTPTLDTMHWSHERSPRHFVAILAPNQPPAASCNQQPPFPVDPLPPYQQSWFKKGKVISMSKKKMEFEWTLFFVIEYCFSWWK